MKIIEGVFLMKKGIQKIAAVLLAGSMALGFAGCGQSGSTNSASPVSGSGTAAPKGTITVMLSEEPKANDPLQLSIQEWEKETGNSAKITVIPYDDQETKWPTMAKAGQVPDVMTSTGLHQLYQDDFVDMSKAFDMSIFNSDDVKLLATSYTSNKITGLPQDKTITNMYYNKDAFDKAGLKAPTKNSEAWTWDEFYANVKKLQSVAGVKYGFACDYSRARYDNFMYSWGGSLMKNVDGKWTITAAQKPSVDALTFFAKMNNDGTMPKQIWAGGTTDSPANYFTNGDVGVLYSGSWQYNAFSKDIKKFKWGIMVSPKQVQQSCISGGSALAVPEQAKNKDLALSFLKWYYTEKNYQTYENNTQQISTVKSVKYVPTNPDDAANWAVLDEEAKNVTPQFLSDESANWRQYINDDYRTLLSKAASGINTPQQSLDAFAQSLNEKSGWEIAK